MDNKIFQQLESMQKKKRHFILPNAAVFRNTNAKMRESVLRSNPMLLPRCIKRPITIYKRGSDADNMNIYSESRTVSRALDRQFNHHFLAPLLIIGHV